MTKPITEQLSLIEAEPTPKSKRTKKSQPVLTTAQQLGSIVKSARDIMRKDKGLNGDLDRLPMLTWIMFLKFLDDMENLRETDAVLKGEAFKPAIEPPYRWRDWAANAEDITGDELIAFVNNDEAMRPDGTRGLGLFAYLKSLQGIATGGDRRDVIATVFKGITNRMINGYLLRDVISKINAIHFTSSEEIHTLGHLYESMLKEMRDAAGDSGEFYTPRAVVRLMVDVINPKLGETVLDPACGTGGFLVETFAHLEKQCHTVEDRRALQERSISGGEAKPLPFLLAQMNLLLHGLEAPQISADNSLKVKVTEIGDRDRYDIVVTAPLFGGEEESGILSNFPQDKQTADTNLLFLQLVMRRLRRQPRPGRAAIIVGNGMLFGDGVCARIKEELLREFNLHTIVRLPNGVFAPYSTIPTNLLFFDRSGPTNDIWYYEQPMAEGRKNYTKTAPIQFEEFADCIAWWNDRKENDHAWRVNFRHIYDEAISQAKPHWDAAEQATQQAKQFEKEEKALSERINECQKPDNLLTAAHALTEDLTSLKIQRTDLQARLREQREIAKEEKAKGDAIYWPIYNLDSKNPKAKQDFEHLPPEQLVEDILQKEMRIAELMTEIKQMLASGKEVGG